MKKFLFVIFLTTIFIGFAEMSSAQTRREHLTEREIELVRDAQELNRRTEVFIHAAERRFYALEPVNAERQKKLEKETEEWGELPKGSRAALFQDIGNILDEATRNIDEVYRHDEKNKLIAKSLRRLAEAAQEMQTRLAALRNQTTDQKEINAIARAESECQSIIETAARLPPPEKEEKKKKSKNS